MSQPTLLTADEVWELAADARVTTHGMYDAVGGPLYADFCAADRQEIGEYVSAIRRTTGDVLELAAGAGRLTLPLLATGRTVVATELSPTMLELLEERLRRAPQTLRRRCEVLRADMTDFALDRNFGAIVLGTTSISLLGAAERAAMFECARAHLAPGGVLLVSTLDLGELGRRERSAEHVMVDSKGDEYVLAERVDDDRSMREVVLAPRRRRDDGAVDFVCRSSVAVLSVDTLEREAAATGLELRSAQRCVGFEDRYLSHVLTFAAEP